MHVLDVARTLMIHMHISNICDLMVFCVHVTRSIGYQFLFCIVKVCFFCIYLGNDMFPFLPRIFGICYQKRLDSWLGLVIFSIYHVRIFG